MVLISRAAVADNQNNHSLTVQSLDEITSQSSDMPALLMSQPVELPAATVPDSKPRQVKKSYSIKPDTTEAVNKAREMQQSLETARQRLLDQEAQIAGLKEKITDLTAKQVATALELANARTFEGRTLEEMQAELAGSQKKNTDITQQLASLTAENTRLTQELSSAKSGDSDAIAELKATLSQSMDHAAQMTKKVTDLTAAQAASEKAQVESKLASEQALTESRQQQSELEKKWQEATAKITAQDKQLETLKAQKPAAVETPAPGNKQELRAYALGTLWGQEVIGAIQKVSSDGIKLDLDQVTSGVNDSIKNSFKLPKEKIIAELDVLNKEVEARDLASQKEISDEGQKYLKNYSKKPGVKRAELGYYYHEIEKGRGAIKKNDVVSIQVKESLVNGTVIKDMTKTSKTLTLPLLQFPPVFSTAIGKMNNKGKLMMVVPPELAYGKEGRPPQIPPESMMVYEITVVNVQSK